MALALLMSAGQLDDATGVDDEAGETSDGEGCVGTTRPNYERVKVGMTLAQVRAIFGCRGKEENQYEGGSSWLFKRDADAFAFIGLRGSKVFYKSKNGF